MTTQTSRRPAGTTTPAGPPPLTPQQAAWIRSELAAHPDLPEGVNYADVPEHADCDGETGCGHVVAEVRR